MSARIVAELASNHGGDLTIAKDLISACADNGADVVKVQAYQARFLAPDDAQRAWLAQAELTKSDLLILRTHAEHMHIGFLVSVFDVDRADFVRNDLGCTEVKIGSGEIRRLALIAKCIADFPVVWLGAGIDPARAEHFAANHRNVRPVYGVSQYPAPRSAEQAALIRAARYHGPMPWGWSNHGEGLNSSLNAIDIGADYIERHVAFSTRGRSQLHDSHPIDLRELRAYRDTHTPAQDWIGDAEAKYLHRWTAADAEAV